MYLCILYDPTIDSCHVNASNNTIYYDDHAQYNAHIYRLCALYAEVVRLNSHLLAFLLLFNIKNPH